MRSRFVAALITCVVLALAGGCSTTPKTDSSSGNGGGASTSSSGADATDSPAASPQRSDSQKSSSDVAEGPVDAPELLQFEASALDGSAFDGTSLVGKPTVLWFWAPWCTTCIGQIPQVEALAGQYPDDINVVGVGGLDSESAIEDFAADLDGVTSLVDDDGAVWQRFEIVEQSSFVILDANGEEVARSGYGDELDVSSEVAGLLN